jgi:phosphotransferase system HPr (HPr) family protein
MLVEIPIALKENVDPKGVARFVQLANHYKSSITLEEGKMTVSGKSMVGMLSLSLHAGNSVVLRVVGEEEEDVNEAAQALQEYLGEEAV